METLGVGKKIGLGGSHGIFFLVVSGVLLGFADTRSA